MIFSSFRPLFFIAVLTLGLSYKAQSFDVPALTGPVIDEVGLLNATTVRQISQSLQSLNKEQQVQLQVYVTKSLQGEDISSVAIQIYDKWKLGDEKTDKGLLFLIAPNEKKLRIEVGQGLEGDIPDVIAKRIISDVVRPYFQRQEFSQGVIQGILALRTYIGSADAGLSKAQISANQETSDSSLKGWAILILIGVWVLLFIFNPGLALYILFAAMRGGGGGGGHGGSWSGGGGRSSGGGASGGW